MWLHSAVWELALMHILICINYLQLEIYWNVLYTPKKYNNKMYIISTLQLELHGVIGF